MIYHSSSVNCKVCVLPWLAKASVNKNEVNHIKRRTDLSGNRTSTRWYPPVVLYSLQVIFIGHPSARKCWKDRVQIKCPVQDALWKKTTSFCSVNTLACTQAKPVNKVLDRFPPLLLPHKSSSSNCSTCSEEFPWAPVVWHKIISTLRKNH